MYVLRIGGAACGYGYGEGRTGGERMGEGVDGEVRRRRHGAQTRFAPACICGPGDSTHAHGGRAAAVSARAHTVFAPDGVGARKRHLVHGAGYVVRRCTEKGTTTMEWQGRGCGCGCGWRGCGGNVPQERVRRECAAAPILVRPAQTRSARPHVCVGTRGNSTRTTKAWQRHLHAHGARAGVSGRKRHPVDSARCTRLGARAWCVVRRCTRGRTRGTGTATATAAQ
ncbi:hypothetical protein B0H16DRAFT_280871 [Mycena metata]|uniref:Uncharacterized protein n=1 Tax=Mycena metata TaxID=1033252 RepID=A0AAD7HPS1_9AGAR|nr:hypothetical protein B0H16DRAFT_280871 [Mycena metata]